jgi:hypothetical protein
MPDNENAHPSEALKRFLTESRAQYSVPCIAMAENPTSIAAKKEMRSYLKDWDKNWTHSMTRSDASLGQPPCDAAASPNIAERHLLMIISFQNSQHLRIS